ncbi:MAG: DUF2334 domain-containing protein [Caulobacteraceae bacterium]
MNPPPTCRIFIRDDDIDALTQELQSFVTTFVERNIPVSYQVIPSKLSAECADFLRRLEARHPRLIEFGQHGLHHEMIVGGRRLLREFGPDRSFLEQLSDIEEGKRLLELKLGPGRQIAIFTPPQHRYDGKTVRAAAEAGHRVFSAACYSTAVHRAAYGLGRALGLSSFGARGVSHHLRVRPEAAIFEASVVIAVDNGRRIRVREAEIERAVRRAMRRSDVVGLMFHHRVYDSAAKRRELESLADRLQRLATGGFCRILEVAEQRASPAPTGP